MKLAMAQMANEGNIESNLKKSIEMIREASLNGADLILFPEVQLTEFFPQYPNLDANKYKVSLDSNIVKAFCDAAKENKIMVVPNLYLLSQANECHKAYDASLLIDDTGKIVGIQKMVHIAEAEQFYEQDYYEPSDDGFHVFDTKLGKIGIVVCFDRHYPESVRTEVLQGADLILIPTVNTKSEPMELFEQEIRVQAFQNCVYIAMCNRVGKEDDMDFAGESLLVSPVGKTIIKVDDTEQIVYIDFDITKAKEVRDKKPYTNLRRTEFYL